MSRKSGESNPLRQRIWPVLAAFAGKRVLKGMAAQILTQANRQPQPDWQPLADMMAQLVCVLDGQGRLIHANRTLERWGLGTVATFRGAHLHEILHPGCVDPHCYFKALGLAVTGKLSRRARIECEVFDPVLRRRLTVLVKCLARPRRQFRNAGVANALVIMSDIAEHPRFHEGLERRAGDERKRRESGEEMQARLLALLEESSDCVAIGDVAGSMASVRDTSWTGQSGCPDKAGREMDVAQVSVANPGNDRQVQNSSTLVGDAAEQVKIAQSLRESHDELRRLSGMLVAIQEGERRRIAMDLHDGLGQSLGLIKLSIESAVRLLDAGATSEAEASLQQLIPRVREALAEVRRVATELRPWILDDLGIVRTLSWFFREFEAAGGDITVEQAINVAEHEVPVPLRITIFRILQEATNNVLKHAGANRMRVGLSRVDDVLSLEVEDDGCGFNPDSIQCVEGRCRGLGLLSMKERACLSGGTYRLSSSPGQGTRIQVSWPCGHLAV